MFGSTNYGNSELRRTFKTPEGAYELKSETRHGQGLLSDRLTARLTVARLGVGQDEQTYVLFNVGESLHVLETKGNEGDSIKVVYFRRDTQPHCHAFAAALDGADVLVGLSTGEGTVVNNISALNASVCCLVMLLSLQTLLEGTTYSSQVAPLATFNGSFRIDDEVSCTAVAWASLTNPSHFVAAYSDGSIRIFDKVKSMPTGDLRTMGISRGLQPNETLNLSCVCITDAAISPDSTKLAVVSKDGLLRVFCAKSRRLQTGFQSYYGGLLCCAWSPDSRYVATGGEDDMVAVFSVDQGCVIAFGEGHSSWISQVAFDSGVDPMQASSLGMTPHHRSLIYRVGSVAQDTQVALWDIEVDLSPAAPQTPRSSIEPPLCENGEGSEDSSLIAPAVAHREMVLVPPVMLHKLHQDPVTDIVFTKNRMFTCDSGGHVRSWKKPKV